MLFLYIYQYKEGFFLHRNCIKSKKYNLKNCYSVHVVIKKHNKCYLKTIENVTELLQIIRT